MQLQRRLPLFSTVILIIFTLLPIASFAADYKGEVPRFITCRTLCILKDGIYVGAGLGYNAYRINQGVSVTDVAGDVAQTNLATGVNGFLGNVFLGYGRYFNWFYIAGEIFANYSGANSNFSIADYQSNFSIRESYGASILPGVSVNDAVLFYFRIGYVRSYFKAQENIPTAFNVDKTDWGNGLHYGLGMETVVYNNLSVRGEYTYTHYDSFSSLLGTNFSPSNNQFVLSALYHFDYL